MPKFTDPNSNQNPRPARLNEQKVAKINAVEIKKTALTTEQVRSNLNGPKK